MPNTYVTNKILIYYLSLNIPITDTFFNSKKTITVSSILKKKNIENKFSGFYMTK